MNSILSRIILYFYHFISEIHIFYSVIYIKNVIKNLILNRTHFIDIYVIIQNNWLSDLSKQVIRELIILSLRGTFYWEVHFDWQKVQQL